MNRENREYQENRENEKHRMILRVKQICFCLIAFLLPVLFCSSTDYQGGEVKKEAQQLYQQAVDAGSEIENRNEDEKIVYRLFDLGEKEANSDLEMAPSDSYFNKQWALYNDGSFTYRANSSDMFRGFEQAFFREWDDFFHTRDSFFPGWDDFFPGWSSSYPDRSNSFWGYSLQTNEGYPAENSGTVTAQQGIDLGMKEAWTLYNGGVRETIVALIDTGVDSSHEDLEGIMWVNEDEIPGDGIDNDGNGYVDDINGWNFYANSANIYQGEEDSHGTHGAGTIAANINDLGIAGIAGNSTVRIMSIKVLGGNDGTGVTEDLIAAVQYAAANGAVICNMSFGTEQMDEQLLEAMEASGMLFVVAAGNGDSQGNGYSIDTKPMYPASYELNNIISVANLQCDGTLHSSSNYGVNSVDLAAPGTYIAGTLTAGEYGYMSGTSMAAPMVTAVAALLYSQYDQITPDSVRKILLESVTKLDTLDGLVKTGGMVNAAAALKYDVSTLPEFDPGTAPDITTEVYEKKEVTKLSVTITDVDGDLTEVRYLVGERSAEEFMGGENGRSFSLNAKGKKTFTPKPGRTYTFYAKDAKGNETIQTVTATIEIEAAEE